MIIQFIASDTDVLQAAWLNKLSYWLCPYLAPMLKIKTEKKVLLFNRNWMLPNIEARFDTFD